MTNMVKISETIICRRFVQNAWKKDLCSNCFKSKEDHVTPLPEKSITYRWTSHVNNFPQHGILKSRQKNGLSKSRTVSFHTAEIEVIGFGGEEISSDDEYPSYGEEINNSFDTDNEDEIKEFRKLTQSNTDFNSVPANLKFEKLANVVQSTPNNYASLRLGKPLTDSNGRRQTLKVIVEPFGNSLSSNKSQRNCQKTDEVSNGHAYQRDEEIKITTDQKNCDVEGDQFTDQKSNHGNHSSARILTETINENTCVKAKESEQGSDPKYSVVSNVPVDSQEDPEGERRTRNEIAENMKNAKKILEPLFRLSSAKREMEQKPKLSIYQCSSDRRTSTLDREQPISSITKDCNLMHLPLVASKCLNIDLNDNPKSREMVDEPNGKTDSDHSSYDVTPACSADPTQSVLEGTLVTPLTSFLLASNHAKPKMATKPSNYSPTENNPMNIPTTDVGENAYSVPSIPKVVQSSLIACHGTGSTKRQAPKPPSSKLVSLDSTFALPTTLACNYIRGAELKRCESPLVSGIRDAISFLGENGPPGAKRKLNFDHVTFSNRNSINLSISMIPNGYYEKRMDDSEGVSVNSSMGSNDSRSRSLSCDSIMSTNSISSTLPLLEKSRKYAKATVKVKSTFRKFLRFSNKDEFKADTEDSAPVAPKRRIEIIHPLDLNKSSIEILRPQSMYEITDRLEYSNKKLENKENCSPLLFSSYHSSHSNCPPGRPSKPPPPPRNQSLDQRLVSEISKPVCPPPPKLLSQKCTQPSPPGTPLKSSSNIYENSDDLRQNKAPAKPQRASSMRNRARPTITIKASEENLTLMSSESDAIPECDRIRLQHERQSSNRSDKPLAQCNTHCGSETESDSCYQSVTSNSGSESCDVGQLEYEPRKCKSIVHTSLEDNYNAVVIANHEALAAFLDLVNQTILKPASMKLLQAVVQLRFSHFNLEETSRLMVENWSFYNAKWAGQSVVLSVSNKPLEPTIPLPAWITLNPLTKFSDVVPSRYIKDTCIVGEMDAYVTVWNEEHIESIKNFCTRVKKKITFSEYSLLLTQLLDALCHSQANGIVDISLDEILICKRESDVESKLSLIPYGLESISPTKKNVRKDRISLCECASQVLDMLMPKQQITDIVKKIVSSEKAACLWQAKAVVEYWLWGPPYNVLVTVDRQTFFQSWLDLERATHLRNVICKKPKKVSLNERCHLMFLSRTTAKLLTEASYMLEKRST